MGLKKHPGWSALDHPADVMIEITGKTFAELCLNAARGLNHFLGEISSRDAPRVERLKIEGDTREEQIVNLLRELLFNYVTDSILVTDLNFGGHSDGSLLVDAFFCPAKRGSNSLEVKGITYHGLSIEEHGDGFRARLVFDV